jgi:hypothetical protein
MARAAVRESVTLAGRAERAHAARAFVSEVLGSGHPCRDDAVWLVRGCLRAGSGSRRYWRDGGIRGGAPRDEEQAVGEREGTAGDERTV